MATKRPTGRRNAFVIDLDTRAVEKLAEALAGIGPDALGEVAMLSVNEVAARAHDKSRENIVAGVNLTEAYVRPRMRVIKATSAVRPEAIVRADGHLSSLGRYFSSLDRQPAKSPIKRLKGDPARGIPKGLKRHTVNVQVMRGRTEPIKDSRVFTVPSIKNSDGDAMIFRRVPGKTRTGKAKMQALYGPSVYQLFRVQAGRLEGAIGDDLVETVSAEALRVVERNLK